MADEGETTVESPKGLPGASCTKGTTPAADTTYYRCYVQYGRYVGEVSSDSLTDVHQQASAQYVLLTKADPNAK